jgi:hypothetical protein
LVAEQAGLIEKQRGGAIFEYVEDFCTTTGGTSRWACPRTTANTAPLPPPLRSPQHDHQPVLDIDLRTAEDTVRCSPRPAFGVADGMYHDVGAVLKDVVQKLARSNRMVSKESDSSPY